MIHIHGVCQLVEMRNVEIDSATSIMIETMDLLQAAIFDSDLQVPFLEPDDCLSHDLPAMQRFSKIRSTLTAELNQASLQPKSSFVDKAFARSLCELLGCVQEGVCFGRTTTIVGRLTERLNEVSMKYCQNVEGSVRRHTTHIAQACDQALRIIHNTIVNGHALNHRSNETYVNGLCAVLKASKGLLWDSVPYLRIWT